MDASVLYGVGRWCEDPCRNMRTTYTRAAKPAALTMRCAHALCNPLPRFENSCDSCRRLNVARQRSPEFLFEKLLGDTAGSNPFADELTAALQTVLASSLRVRTAAGGAGASSLTVDRENGAKRLKADPARAALVRAADAARQVHAEWQAALLRPRLHQRPELCKAMREALDHACSEWVTDAVGQHAEALSDWVRACMARPQPPMPAPCPQRRFSVCPRVLARASYAR